MVKNEDEKKAIVGSQMYGDSGQTCCEQSGLDSQFHHNYERHCAGAKTSREKRRSANVPSIMVRGLDGNIFMWNPGSELNYGWSKSQAVGSVSHSLLRTQFPYSIDQINAELLRDGVWEGVLIHTMSDGTKVKVHSRWELQTDDSSKDCTVFEINRDFTPLGQEREASDNCECLQIKCSVGKDRIKSAAIIIACFLGVGIYFSSDIPNSNLFYSLLERDQEVAFEAVLKTAQQGNAEAQFDLAQMYENREMGSANYAEALTWYQKAAEQEYAPAQYILGLKYYRGERVVKDFVKALQWLQKAADQGDTRAQLQLAVMYQNGEGVPQNQKQAYIWFAAAKILGAKEAAAYEDSAAKKLSSDELAQAQETARAIVRQIAVRKYN